MISRNQGHRSCLRLWGSEKWQPVFKTNIQTCLSLMSRKRDKYHNWIISHQSDKFFPAAFFGAHELCGGCKPLQFSLESAWKSGSRENLFQTFTSLPYLSFSSGCLPCCHLHGGMPCYHWGSGQLWGRNNFRQKLPPSAFDGLHSTNKYCEIVTELILNGCILWHSTHIITTLSVKIWYIVFAAWPGPFIALV